MKDKSDRRVHIAAGRSMSEIWADAGNRLSAAMAHEFRAMMDKYGITEDEICDALDRSMRIVEQTSRFFPLGQLNSMESASAYVAQQTAREASQPDSTEQGQHSEPPSRK
jgi:hypothetical protein